MNNFISRKEICEELDIDSETLRHYEAFIELPFPEDGEYSIAIAKTISKIHDLKSQGFDFSDIRNLGNIAEQFKDQIPSLRSYEDLSPKKNIKEALAYYQELLQTFSERESKLKERIIELEEQLGNYNSMNEETGYLKTKIERYEAQTEEFKRVYSEYTDYLAELESKIAQHEIQSNDLYYQLVSKENTITKLQNQLEGKEPQQPMSAIDIDTLLKKKEREFEIKHQRKIFDLKKQVENIVAQKEEEWKKSLEKPSSPST